MLAYAYTGLVMLGPTNIDTVCTANTRTYAHARECMRLAAHMEKVPSSFLLQHKLCAEKLEHGRTISFHRFTCTIRAQSFSCGEGAWTPLSASLWIPREREDGNDSGLKKAQNAGLRIWSIFGRIQIRQIRILKTGSGSYCTGTHQEFIQIYFFFISIRFLPIFECWI